MSLITDQFGNRGIDRHGLGGRGGPDGKLQPDEIDIRSTVQVGGFGPVIKKPPNNLRPKPMYIELDLQNTCDISDLDECNDNVNCQINNNLTISNGSVVANFLRNTYKGGKDEVNNKEYWEDKWSNQDNDSNVCGWDGISCKTLDNGKEYISNIDINDKFFKDPKKELKYCNYKPTAERNQNEWVNKQSIVCESIKGDEECSDNTFCSWKDANKQCYGSDGITKHNNEKDCVKEGNEWKVGKRDLTEKYKENETTNNGSCSLTPKYKQLSGLNPNDEFKTKTMDQILGEINNGRVADINIFDNVTKDTRKDVIMSQNNSESSVKGLVEETALSKYFFSNENIDALQQTIRYRVYQKTNEVIDYQSSNELYIIMRSVLLQHGNFRVSAKDLLQEVLQLNKRVEVYAVNEVASNVVQYKGYLKDVEKLPIPMDRPRYDDNGSRNRTYDLSNHISPMATEGWQSRHRSELLK